MAQETLRYKTIPMINKLSKGGFASNISCDKRQQSSIYKAYMEKDKGVKLKIMGVNLLISPKKSPALQLSRNRESIEES